MEHFFKITGFTYSFFFFLLAASLLAVACNSSENKETPALGVPVPELNTVDDTRKYVNDVINAPGQTGYTLPNGIVAEGYAASSENLNKLYPEFYGKGGGSLLEAVKAHPLKYQEMIRDVMALRDHFNPDWRLERNKVD